MPSREPMPELTPRGYPSGGAAPNALACESDTCRPAGKVQQQEPDKLRRLRGGSRQTWRGELLVEGSHLLTRCEGRQHGLEFVVGGPPVARVQCARLSAEPLVFRLGPRQARRRRVGRRRLGRRSKIFQSKECLRFHALSSMPGQRAFGSERPRPAELAALRRCRRRDSNPRHAGYDSADCGLSMVWRQWRREHRALTRRSRRGCRASRRHKAEVSVARVATSSASCTEPPRVARGHRRPSQWCRGLDE
jgi:hypothetical protein